jgi:hypothetical protein
MMKKNIFPITTIGLILLFFLTETACFHRFRYIERPVPPPFRTDDVYAQSNTYQYEQAEPATPVSYQEFYDELSPYGSWIDYSTYGYVWIPRVSIDFHPYATHGHWVMTNYGWTWISDFRWGWAAFHYGRWAYEPHYGWVWVPDNVWGPAWVDWRESADYFGWAPLGPVVNIAVTIRCPFDHYRFVPRRHFMDRHLYNYYADRHHNTTIINQTTVINETHVVNKRKYSYGPRKDFVETAVGQKINAAEISDNPKPDADVVEKDRVKVYRPRMDNVSTNAPKPTPKRVVPTADLPSVPDDRHLTPSISKNTEGGEVRPSETQPRREDLPQEKPNVNRQPIPKDEQRRPNERQPRVEDVPPVKPDAQPVPRNEPRPQERQPRREDVPQVKPDVQPQPIPKDEQRRPQERQPRREDAPPVKPDVKQRPVPKYEPRQKEVPQEQRPKTQPKTEQPKKENTRSQPTKEKETVPPKTKNLEKNN